MRNLSIFVFLVLGLIGSGFNQSFKVDCPELAFNCAASQGKIIALQCIRSIPKLDANQSWYCDDSADLSKNDCDVF